MSDTINTLVRTNVRVTLPVVAWFGAAFWTANQPGNGFWDGVVWMWYLGRYIAANFTMMHY